MLLDDDFRSIVRAVAEGRQLFRNLQLSFMYLLTIHIPLVVSATLIPLAGLPLLYLPIHIVWLETLIHPTALLVFQELPASERLEPVRRAGRHASSQQASGPSSPPSACWSRCCCSGSIIGASVPGPPTIATATDHMGWMIAGVSVTMPSVPVSPTTWTAVKSLFR